MPGSAEAQHEPGATTGSPPRYDLLDPVVLTDPYPTYHRMRAADPLYRDRRFMGWMLTRYDDVASVLRDPRVSAHRPGPEEPIPRALEAVADEVRGVRAFESRWLLYTDPPDHTRLRGLVTQAFTPRRVEQLRIRVQALIDDLLDAVCEAGAMDVIRDLAKPLPALVIAELLGLPAEDRPQFQAWSEGLAAGMILSASSLDAAEGFRRAYRSQQDLVAYFRTLLAKRRSRPGSDLLSALVTAEADGTLLDEQELLATCVLLLFAGHETTTHLIGNGLLALLNHPDQLNRLRQDPGLIGSAVEELLRYDGPVQATARRSTVDMDIGGQIVRAGEFLMLVLGAANRDPARFAEPDRLDLGRPDNRHLAFALGPHFCLGAGLARLEAQLAIATVVRHSQPPTYISQAGELAAAKAMEPWLAEAPSHCLQQTLRDLDRACRQYGVWQIHWRSRRRWAPSFRFPDPEQIGPVQRLAHRLAEVRLPKVGRVRFRWSQLLGGVVRHTTLQRAGEHWYISFCVEDGVVEVAPNGLPPVGIDRGVVLPVATSDGKHFTGSGITPGEIRQLRHLARRLARQKKGSNRRRNTIRAIGRVHERVRNRRLDFSHQTAHRLTTQHGLIVIEDLRVQAMTASARGTPAAPGRHVRQKAGLNRSILDKAWGRVRSTLVWHGRKNGCSVVAVPAAFTSQTCSACGYVAAESRESQADFCCVACGYKSNADVNAARNILAAGLAASGRGGVDVGPPVKRQPLDQEVAHAPV